jgi:hypothetical protein
MVTKNPRNAGRKPKPADEKMVKHGGGMVTPEIFEWMKINGWNEVRKAIEFYRQNHS